MSQAQYQLSSPSFKLNQHKAFVCLDNCSRLEQVALHGQQLTSVALLPIYNLYRLPAITNPQIFKSIKARGYLPSLCRWLVMFKLGEVVIISFESFQHWPAQIMDVYYPQNQTAYYDLVLFHRKRYRVVLPLREVRKLDKLSMLSQVGKWRGKGERASAYQQAWDLALKALFDMNKQNQPKVDSPLTENHSKANTEQSLQSSQQLAADERGFSFYQNRLRKIYIGELEATAKTLRQQALGMKFQDVAEFELLSQAVAFKELISSFMTFNQCVNLKTVITTIQDTINIVLLIKKSKSEIIPILEDVISTLQSSQVQSMSPQSNQLA